MIRPDAAQPRRREGTQNEGKDTEGQAPGPPPPPPARQSTPTFHGLDPLLQLPLTLLLQQLLLLLLLHREKDLALLLLLPALLFLYPAEHRGLLQGAKKLSQHVIKQNQAFALRAESTFSIPHAALDSWMTSDLNASSSCHLCNQ